MTFLPHAALDLFIDRLAALSPLSSEERAAIAGIGAQPLEVRANGDIFPVRASGDHACLIVEGLAARFAQARSGERQLLALHLAGDMVGLQSAASPGVYFPTQALCAVKALCLSVIELRTLAHAYPAISRAFWAYSAVDAAVLARWTANLGRKSAQGRMAHLLCEIGMRREQHGQGSRFEFMFEATQTHLADALGMTSVHVNRTVRALREAGLVSVTGRRVRILDWPRLAAIGEFKPDYLQIDPVRHAGPDETFDDSGLGTAGVPRGLEASPVPTPAPLSQSGQ
jgi:CRP-like cAMP-binding protein